MYNNSNGRPPFVPPGGLPPFPPNLNRPPSAMPPFRPNFVPPPFPPNFSPVRSATPPLRPPPAGFPARPIPGLPPIPSTLPPVPIQTPNFVREVKTTSVFVGSINTGISDKTLEELLNACGPLHELKRVSGASGKPQAFGFALFESPEVVMRCIRCLNGVELPDMDGNKPPKALLVKVDDKTREFLDEFEKNLGRSDDDETADALCRKSIGHIVARLIDPNAPIPDGLPDPGSKSPLNVVVPAHLQDLKEGDLPEDQRVAVLDQIAVFRESAARRERERKNMEEEKERLKGRQPQKGSSVGTSTHVSSEYGYGSRAFNHRQDPQSYSEPVPFVKAQAPETKDVSDRTDEEEHEIQLQRKSRERETSLRDFERRVENRERQRIDALNRELANRRQQSDIEERSRNHIRSLMEVFDNDHLFFSDRLRWRNQRQQRRKQEYQDDVRDRQREEDESRLLEQESELFLKNQMAEMAEIEAKQKEAGLLTEDAAPIKLALNTEATKKESDIPGRASKPAASRVAFDADDEENQASIARRRTLVKLEYEGDGSLTEAEALAKRNALLLAIRSQIPQDRRRLWNTRIEWAAISDKLLSGKIQSFTSEKLKEYLGEPDQDLVEYIIDILRDRKGPDDVLKGLEPVLVEEAPALAVQIWRLLAFESAAYVAGIETGSMTI